jgi:putative ABC transport system permease protein
MTPDIELLRLAVGYAMLVVPLWIMWRLDVPLIRRSLVAVLRMSVQLLFVGLYLHFVFDRNSFWLTAAWLLVMIGVADVTVLRDSGLRLSRLWYPLGLGLAVGAAVPLGVMLGPVLQRPTLLDAQYAIPLGGMVLGNCLRADIIGLKGFYRSLLQGERVYQLALSQGAVPREALRPFVREACQAALGPTVATMTTIGLVSLPGMMTGVILGGTDPLTAIKYQVLIMIAILTGTAITVAIAIRLSWARCLDAYGNLDRTVFVRG